GQRLASAGDDQLVRIWKAGSWDVMSSSQRHSGKILQVAFSPDGAALASCAEDHTAKICDQSGTELQTFHGHTKAVTCLAFTQDGKRLVTGSLDRSIRLWDVSNGQSLRTLHGPPDEIRALAFSPESGELFSTGDLNIHRWPIAVEER